MTSQHPSAFSKKTSIPNHPFIWGNIAFIAGMPWFLTLSMAGLAVGDPILPAWLEIFLLVLPAIAFTVWVQWQQPLSPFSLWFIAKPPESLSEDERRVLTLIKQQQNGWYVTGWIAIAIAIVMSGIFCKLYVTAPLAQAIAPFPAGLRLFGIIWAEVCFLVSNILLQSGMTALRIKLLSDSELSSLQPFATDKIKNNFTIIGWRSPQILKFFEEDLIADAITPKDSLKVEIEEIKVVETQAIAESSEALVQELVQEDSQELVQDLFLESPQDLVQEDHQELVLESPQDSVQEDSQELVAETSQQDPQDLVQDDSQELVLESPQDSVQDNSQELVIDLVLESPQEKLQELVQENSQELVQDLFLESPQENPQELVQEDSQELVQESYQEDSQELVQESPQDSVQDNYQELVIDLVLESPQENPQELVQEDSQELVQDLFLESPQDLVQEDHQELVQESPQDSVQENSQELVLDSVQEDSQELVLDLVQEPHQDLVQEDAQELVLDLVQEDSQELVQESHQEDSQELAQELVLESPQELVQEISQNLVQDLEINNFSEEIVAEEDVIDESVNPSIVNEVIEQSCEQLLDTEATLENITQSNDIEIDLLIESSEIEIVEKPLIIETEPQQIITQKSAVATSANLNLKRQKKSIDLFGKSRKKGFAQKNHGFGKSIKTETNNEITTSNLEFVEPAETNLSKEELEIETSEISNLVAEESVQSLLETSDSGLLNIQDNLKDDAKIDDQEELDEKAVFNIYVENILQGYLEEPIEENQEIENIIEIASVSELATDIAEDVLLSEEISTTAIPEPITLPVEAIAPLPETIQQISEDNSSSNKDHKYLVQEFLVDKFLARLEELNSIDKTTTKANLEPNAEELSEDSVNPLISENSELEEDEFADLEALLNRNKPQED